MTTDSVTSLHPVYKGQSIGRSIRGEPGLQVPDIVQYSLKALTWIHTLPFLPSSFHSSPSTHRRLPVAALPLSFLQLSLSTQQLGHCHFYPCDATLRKNRFASHHQAGNDLQEDPTTCGSKPLIGSENTEHRSFLCVEEGRFSRTLVFDLWTWLCQEQYTVKREKDAVQVWPSVCVSVLQQQTVYWILAASKGWIKQTYRKIMHTQSIILEMRDRFEIGR